MTKTCEYCGEPFEAKRADARFHSDACRMAASRAVTATKPVTDSDESVTAPVTDNRADVLRRANALRKEAKRLTALQVKERGTVENPHGESVPGPYAATSERERRASKIVSLRRQAALLEHPIARRTYAPS
jgi:hypothetical protein